MDTSQMLVKELRRNLHKQEALRIVLSILPKGYLSICHIDGADYVYRKHRDGRKIVSVYIGTPGSLAVREAQRQRDAYIQVKESLASLRAEEKRLRRAIKSYAGS